MKKEVGRYEPDIYFYLNEPAREAFVRDLLHPTTVLAEPDRTFPEEKYLARVGPGPQRTGAQARGIQSDLRQLYGVMRVHQLCRQSGIAYDWILRLRTDMEITHPPEPLESLDPHFIYIPKFANWYGYNDRFAIGPPALMDVYMNRFDILDTYFDAGGTFHPEALLAWQLRRHHIPVARTAIRFNLLRMDGSRDGHYWNPQWCDVP